MLLELQSRGMPLESETERPHVYWSVPRNWFPGSVMFKQEEVPELLRQLRRVPHGQGRARLLDLVLARFPSAPGEAAVVVTREASPEEERYLSILEDAGLRRTSLHMRYLTAGRVDEGTRHASVHQVIRTVAGHPRICPWTPARPRFPRESRESSVACRLLRPPA